MKRFSILQLTKIACKQMGALEDQAHAIAGGFIPTERYPGISSRTDAMAAILDCAESAVSLLAATEVFVGTDTKAMRRLNATFVVVVREIGKHLIQASRLTGTRDCEAGR